METTSNFKTSLTQWGSALSAADQEALEAARKALGDDASLPKAVKSPAPRFDLWAKGHRELFTESGTATKEGSAFTTYLGADYRWHRKLLLGGMVQLDDSRQNIVAAPDAAGGQAFMVGPYFAYQLTPNVTFDARAAWGTSHDSAVVGADTTSFATGRMLGEAKLSGSSGPGPMATQPKAAPSPISMKPARRSPACRRPPSMWRASVSALN